MKQLFLIRHAEALRETGLADIDRPLSEVGRKNAHKMAVALKAAGVCPDNIISSPANRARETANILADLLEFPLEKILLSGSVYDSSNMETYLDILAENNDKYENIMLFGHNPSITELASVLTEGFSYIMPPAAVVGISFTIDNWQNLSPGNGKLFYYNTPSRRIK